MTEFVERFEEFVGASGWRSTPSPAGLVDHWRDFVETCEEAYRSTIYDFENERAVRDLIESALNDPILRRFPELADLRASVDDIDRRFRRACRDDVSIGDPSARWWNRCVPRHADGEFAADVQAQFGVEPS